MTATQPNAPILTVEEFEKIVAKREQQTSHPGDSRFKSERKINQWMNELVTENDQQRVEVSLMFLLYSV